MRSAKEYRDLLRERGVFYTPPELAMKMKAYLPEGTREVYDPACGAGGLLMVFDDDVSKYGQDTDGEALREAGENIPNFIGYTGDTLKDPAFIWRKFPAIMANPPYSLKWDQAPADDPRWEGPGVLAPKSRADWAFLLHCLFMLAEGGTAVTLNATGILFRDGAEGKIRKWFVEQNYIDTVEEVDGGSFEDTGISTCIVVLKRYRPRTGITFRHNGNEAVASLEEVRQQDYCLMPSRYGADPRAEKPGGGLSWEAAAERIRDGGAGAMRSLLASLSLADKMNGTNEAGKLRDALLRVIAEWEEANADQDAGREAD